MTPKKTGARREVEGVVFDSWHMGIMRYEWRSADGRITVLSNGSHRTTYSAYVDDTLVGKRYFDQIGAARAGVKALRKKAPGEPGARSG